MSVPNKKDVRVRDRKEEVMLKRIEHLRNVKGAPKLAARTLKKYLAIISPKRRTAKMYLLLANLSIDIGETKRAFAAFRLAAGKAKTAGDTLTLADILRKWGYLYLHTGEARKAKEKIINSVEIVDALLGSSRAKDVTRVAANCYASKGNYYHSIGNREAAKRAYQKALRYAEATGYKERAVTVLGDLGTIAIESEMWREAEELLLKTRDRARKYYQHALPSSLLRLGRLYRHPRNPRRDPHKARIFFEESLKIARKSGWKREQADVLRELGREQEAEKIYRSIGYGSHIAKRKTSS